MVIMAIDFKTDAQKIFELSKENKELKEALAAYTKQNNMMGDELLRSGLYQLKKDGTIKKRFNVHRN